MDATEQAAEQIVRMTLAGSEVALRLTGVASKNVAAALMAAAASSEKTKGKTRLAALLKSGKELKVFELKQPDLERFAAEAKRYGVLYTIIKPDSQDTPTLDVLVRAEDASKINRILENLGYGTVKKEQAAPARATEATPEQTPEQPTPQVVSDTHEQANIDALAEILGTPTPPKDMREPDPLAPASRSETPLEATSVSNTRSGEATTKKALSKDSRRSVKRDLQAIREKRQNTSPKAPLPATPERHAQTPRTPSTKVKSRTER